MCGAGYQPDRRIPDRSGNWAPSQNVCKSRKTGFVGRPLPGREESAGDSVSNRCARGNRKLKRVLTECAWAAVRNKKSQFYRLFQRWRGALGVRKAIIAVAHRMLLVIWKLLHEGET